MRLTREEIVFCITRGVGQTSLTRPFFEAAIVFFVFLFFVVSTFLSLLSNRFPFPMKILFFQVFQSASTNFFCIGLQVGNVQF